MFARVTTYELEEGRASESIDVFRPAIDRVRDLDGFVEAFFLVERDGRRAISMTLWETLETMERSRVAASSARMEAASQAEAEVTSTYELEVGIHASAGDPAEELLLGGRGLA